MKASDARAVSAAELEDVTHDQESTKSLEVSVQRIEERGGARTGVLNQILDRQGDLYWYHGGLNE